MTLSSNISASMMSDIMRPLFNVREVGGLIIRSGCLSGHGHMPHLQSYYRMHTTMHSTSRSSMPEINNDYFVFYSREYGSFFWQHDFKALIAPTRSLFDLYKEGH